MMKTSKKQMTIDDRWDLEDFLEERNISQEALIDFIDEDVLMERVMEKFDAWELIKEAVHNASPRTCKDKEDIKQICNDIIEFNYTNIIR